MHSSFNKDICRLELLVRDSISINSVSHSSSTNSRPRGLSLINHARSITCIVVKIHIYPRIVDGSPKLTLGVARWTTKREIVLQIKSKV